MTPQLGKGGLLGSDLDRTLIPNGFHAEPEAARARLADELCARNLTLAFVSGRSLSLQLAALEEWALPQPQWLIADVGTSIYQRHADGRCESMQEWTALLSADWQDVNAAEVWQALEQIPGLVRQSECTPLKWSFFLHDLGRANEVLEQVRQLLQRLRIPARQIWSVDETQALGLLDILPPQADKASALLWLAGYLGFTPEQVIYAGDSGNDLAALTCGVRGILVGNATDAFRAEVSALAKKNRAPLYLASASYAAGICEGLAFWSESEA